MIKLLALFLACLHLTSAIRNGKPVSADELKRLFSFVVSVKMCGSKECYVCTGSLVSPNTVLLSAHCFCGTPESPKITVYFKSLNAILGRRKVTGSLFKKKPIKCNNNTIYQGNIDIAVIKLNQRILDINPVQLDCGSVPTGQRVTMIGYGQDESYDFGTLRFGHTRTTKCPPGFTDAVCVDIKDERATSTYLGDGGVPLLIHYRSSSSAGEVYLLVGIAYGRADLSDWPLPIDTWTEVRPHCRWIRSSSA